MVSVVCANMANISDTTNIIMIQFGYTQIQGSFCLCGFYVAGLIGALIYDKYLEQKGNSGKYLVLYTSFGFFN